MVLYVSHTWCCTCQIHGVLCVKYMVFCYPQTTSHQTPNTKYHHQTPNTTTTQMSSRARRLASKLGGSFKRNKQAPVSSDGTPSQLSSPASPAPHKGQLTPSREAIPQGIAGVHKEKFDTGKGGYVYRGDCVYSGECVGWLYAGGECVPS